MKFSAEPVAAPEMAAALALNTPPNEVTFHEFLPYLLVAEKGGTLSYMTRADLATPGVQIDREETTAIDADAAATGDCTYVLKKYEKRSYVPERLENNYRDETNLKTALGRLLSGKFFRGLEAGWINYLKTAQSVATQLKEGEVLDAVSEAADDLRDFGAPRIVMTAKCFRKFKKLKEVKEVLRDSALSALAAEYVKGTPEALRNVLTDLTNVDKIVIANSEVWTSAFDDEFFVVGVRPEDLGKETDVVSTIKSKVCGGFLAYGLPPVEGCDTLQPASIRVWGDMTWKRNYADADAEMAFVNLDKKSVRRFKLPAGSLPA